jgi:WD40 repeat protein
MLNLDANDQTSTWVLLPDKCSLSNRHIAVTAAHSGLHLFTIKGKFVHTVPGSLQATAVAFQPHNPRILAIGLKDGSVHMWDVYARRIVISIYKHDQRIINMRFAPDGCLLLSSCDHTASIILFDVHSRVELDISLEGHMNWVNDITAIPTSHNCVTCSGDRTVKVWDSQTGACLHTLSQHTDAVIALAMHGRGHVFASGSTDQHVIIWSSQTLNPLHHMQFPQCIEALIFGQGDALFVSVYAHGVVSSNAVTGEIGPVVIQGGGVVSNLAFGPLCMRNRLPCIRLDRSYSFTCSY